MYYTIDGNFMEDAPVDTILAVMFMWITILFVMGFFFSIFKAIYNYFLFKKFGRNGVEGIIPIYNSVIKLNVLGMPIWAIVLYFVPITTLIINIFVCIDLSRKFKKSPIYAVGLIFLPIIFYPILAFSKDEFDPSIPSIISNERECHNLGYCTNCGSLLKGDYCSKCGMKKEQ